MNYIFNVEFGGIFSKFILAIQNIQNVNPNFDSVYINNTDKRTLVEGDNIFNTVLEQKNDGKLIQYECKNLGTYNINNPIENSYNLNDYKTIVKKIKTKDSLLEKIDYYTNKLNIDSSVIGLHIRLCDMNIIHGREYGLLNFNNFLKEIRKYATNRRIFVASDNYESIKKLKKEFGDNILYIPDFIRGIHENENTLELQLNNFKNPKFWEEAFIEMFLLSKCGMLICRTSNLNNVSVIYSDTIKKIIRL